MVSTVLLVDCSLSSYRRIRCHFAVAGTDVLLSGFCFTVLGALLSYLWFNIYPARFFMGDVGSFAYGTSLGVVAMMTNTLFLSANYMRTVCG